MKFFDVIKYVKDKTPLNPVYSTVKEWCLLLLEQNVTKREVEQEARMELIPCRMEEKNRRSLNVVGRELQDK